MLVTKKLEKDIGKAELPIVLCQYKNYCKNRLFSKLFVDIIAKTFPPNNQIFFQHF